MKGAVTVAFETWLKSDNGKICLSGKCDGIYLRNRLEAAFLAGVNWTLEKTKRRALDQGGAK